MIARELNRLTTPRIECAHRNREGFKGPRQNWRCQLDQRHALNEGAGVVAMRPLQPLRVQPSPDFVFEQPARNQRLTPKAWRARAVFGQELR